MSLDTNTGDKRVVTEVAILFKRLPRARLEMSQRAQTLAAETQDLHSKMTIGNRVQSTSKIQAFVSEFSEV